jgi:hypothetical protein
MAFMWLVLCPADDESALWAYQGLQLRGLEPLELVTTEALASGVLWEHRVGADGACISIRLADGRSIRDADVRGVFNRLVFAPSESLLLIHPVDRDYVQQELHSFFLSWLHALPRPMINRPSPTGLSGQWRHISEWIYLAARAGLPAPYYRQSSRDFTDGLGVAGRLPTAGPVHTVISIGGTLVGAPVPPSIGDGCRRLAGLAGTALLGVEFTMGPDGEWTFAGATPRPDLRLGGEPLLDALARALLDEPEAEP